MMRPSPTPRCSQLLASEDNSVAQTNNAGDRMNKGFNSWGT